MSFFYVYIIQSQTDKNKYYTGYTENLENRIKKHNEGGCPYTSEHKPWKIKTAIAFTDKTQAKDFEKYLKTSSGRTFAKKRL